MLDQQSLMSDGDSPMIAAVSTVRQSVLQRATALIGGATLLPFAEQFDALPSVSALLMTALEELRVAEEELRQQNAELLMQRAGTDARARRYQRMFAESPAAALLTDSVGTIIEANIAAGALVRRTVDALVRKPVAALVPSAAREEFRRQLTRISSDDGVTDWRFTLARVGHVAIDISACVRFVDGVGRSGAGALYWALRPVATV